MAGSAGSATVAVGGWVTDGPSVGPGVLTGVDAARGLGVEASGVRTGPATSEDAAVAMGVVVCRSSSATLAVALGPVVATRAGRIQATMSTGRTNGNARATIATRTYRGGPNRSRCVSRP